MKKKLFSGLLIAAVLMFSIMPFSAFAAEATVGDFVVATDIVNGYTYNSDGGAVVFTQPGTYTISMKSGVTTTASSKIQINGGTADAPITIILNNVSVKNTYCAFDLSSTSYANLILAEGTVNSMVSGGDYAGVCCRIGATLVISGTGSLNAVGEKYGAGIGGKSDDMGASDAGTIIINSGTITASSQFGAGIGGAYYHGDGGTIIINGGTITATGGLCESGDGGAGIGGGGYGGDGGNITINGGTVIAGSNTAGVYYGGGAGIGGGDMGDGGTITINGGTVTATGGACFKYKEGGAGIGGGADGNGGTVIITGGSVKVTAGYNAATIGAGSNGTDDGTLSNGYKSVYPRGVYDVFSETDPQEVSYDIPIISGGVTMHYTYTGTGHGNGETILYFYLPEGQFSETVLTSDTNPIQVGDSVTFTATVTQTYGSAAEKGDVDFYDGDTLLGTATVSNGTAAFTTSILSAGLHTINATYNGYEGGFGSYSEEFIQRVYAGTIYDISAGDININSGGTYLITGSTTEFVISVNTTDAVTVLLDNVTIDFSQATSYMRCPFNSNRNVTILLEGQNVFTCGTNTNSAMSNQPAIKVEVSETLTIDNAEGSTGSVSVTGGYGMAGIGGGYGVVSGNVVINGGTVEATGGKYGAGIGGGQGTMGGTVTVNGGTVIAQGGFWASGIGGGQNGVGGTVIINGGYVMATGGDSGAGIGGGYGKAGGNVTITNGTITATGGLYSSGIGGGRSGTGGTVVITGGSVKAAIGSGDAEAIGHGAYIETDTVGTLTNGYEAVTLTIQSDMVDADNPTEVSWTSFVTGSEKTYTYCYTGKGHGGGDTNLYFYLPASASLSAENSTSGESYVLGGVPDTGSGENVTLWAGLTATCAFGGLLVLLKRKSEKA